MIRRMLALTLIAVVASVLVAGCSETQEETIENTIRDYYSAYNAEDWQACLGHLDDTSGAGTAMIESTLKTARATTGEVTLESVTNVSITGSTATATVTFSWAGGGGRETQKWNLVKNNGHWKISYSGG